MNPLTLTQRYLPKSTPYFKSTRITPETKTPEDKFLANLMEDISTGLRIIKGRPFEKLAIEYHQSGRWEELLGLVSECISVCSIKEPPIAHLGVTGLQELNSKGWIKFTPSETLGPDIYEISITPIGINAYLQKHLTLHTLLRN